MIVLDRTRSEQEQIDAYRMLRLLDLGFPTAVAARRALTRFDLHQLEALVARGCNLETAWRIVREEDC